MLRAAGPSHPQQPEANPQMIKALTLLVALILSHHRIKALQDKHPDLDTRFLIMNFLLDRYSQPDKETICEEMAASEQLLRLGGLHGHHLPGLSDPWAPVRLSLATLRFLRELLEDGEAAATFARLKSELKLQGIDLEDLRQEVMVAEIISRHDPYVKAVAF